MYQSLSQHKEKELFASELPPSLFTFKYFVRIHIYYNKCLEWKYNCEKNWNTKSTKGSTYDNISAQNWSYHLFTKKSEYS